jgi:lipid-binding SYLF domain-containing protein
MARAPRIVGVALVWASLIAMLALLDGPRVASANDVDEDAKAALNALYAGTPGAKVLGESAKAVLVFPNIVKAGFIVAGSYGLQAGVQAFGYAMFLMTDAAVNYLDRSEGWEVGVGPSFVVVDVGMARTLTTTTLQSDVYAFVFDQKGLMAGLGLQGSKITRVR